MNVTPSTYSVCHASLKKAGSVVLVLLMLSVTAGTQAATPLAICFPFQGDVTFNPPGGLGGTLVAEIGGLVPCPDPAPEYDRYDIPGTLTILGTTLEIVLFNGFVPVLGDRFDILDWGSITGTFGTIDTSAAVLPAPLVWDTSQLYLTGELIVGTQAPADGDLAPWNNPDGLINAADVLIAEQLVLGQRVPGALQFTHGDMNGDSVLNTADLLLIMRAILP